MPKGHIYKFTCISSNKSYIGKTRQSLEKRISAHKKGSSNIKNRNYSTHFYRALRKYGWNNFIITTLQTIENDDLIQLDIELYRLERTYITLYDTLLNGYNSDEGGIGTCGMKHSEETKKKISSSNMGKTMSTTNKINMSASAKIRATSENMKYVSNYALLVHIKPVIASTKEGVEISSFVSIKEGADFYNTNASSITKCCKNKIKYSGKFPDQTKIYWRYKE